MTEYKIKGDGPGGWVWCPVFVAACEAAYAKPVFNQHGNWIGPTADTNCLPHTEFVDWLVNYSGHDWRSIKKTND